MKQKLLWVLLLALGLRIGAALSVHHYVDSVNRDFLIPGDAEGYWKLARKLADGESYSVYSPPRRVMRMPGYPLFIAAVLKTVGESFLAVRLVQAVVGTLAVWFVHVLGSMLIDAPTGLLAAFLAAVAPTFVGFTPLILSETLFAATIVGSLILMARLADWWPGNSHRLGADSQSPRLDSGSVHNTKHERSLQPLDEASRDEAVLERGLPEKTASGKPASEKSAQTGESHDRATRAGTRVRVRLWLAFGVGVGVAIACYTRPSWLLTAPLFGVIHVLMVWKHTEADSGAASSTGVSVRTTLAESLLVLAGLAAVLTPWTVRNWFVTGHFVPTTLWVGPSLYDGLNPDATGASDMDCSENDKLLESMSEYEMDRAYRRRAWEFVRENPGKTLSLAIAKLSRFWKPWPNAEQFSDWWMRLPVAAFFIPAVGLAVFEAIRRRGDVRCLLLTLGPILYFSVIHAVFVGSLRYRLPAEYPLLILSAAGLITVWDWWAGRETLTAES